MRAVHFRGELFSVERDPDRLLEQFLRLSLDAPPRDLQRRLLPDGEGVLWPETLLVYRIDASLDPEAAAAAAADGLREPWTLVRDTFQPRDNARMTIEGDELRALLQAVLVHCAK